MSGMTAGAAGAIKQLFEDGLRSCLAPGAQEQVAMAWEAVPQSAGERGAQPAVHVVLCIVSYRFRIVTLFEFDAGDTAAVHLARATRHAPEQLVGQALVDACAESANMICGAVNRGLATVFRHVGMSTPVVLDAVSAGDFALFEPAGVLTLDASFEREWCVRVAVCVCAAAGTPLDFRIERTLQDDAAAGELEFF